ncbi:MAG TPA: flavodoxin domain-containing protein [Ilumatobacteraceae bacterium]|nr:flavodoxin domain-containing protein [Ilumatobacteraceae bacterium]
MSVARVTIVYESMFGSTRKVAEAIARGLRPQCTTRVVRVSEASDSIVDTDLLIVGAPTHAHGLSRPQSRAEAAKWAADPERGLELEPGAEGTGMREWLDRVDELPARSAAFDTRADIPEIFSGSAARKIEHQLRRRRSDPIIERQSFLVDKRSSLESGELDRAEEWGREIAAKVGDQVGAS